jgi:predicted phage terminase large subunit-like protein
MNSNPMSTVTTRRQLEALVRSRLLIFVMKFFPKLLMDTSQPFEMEPYVDAMCHALQKCIDGECKRLIIEVPPRHGKSIIASNLFVAYLLGLNPSCKILVASYGADLAEAHTRNTRIIMRDEAYMKLFPDTVVDRDRAGELSTTRGGVRKGVSVGGATTGFGADIIIIDDLIKADSAYSEAELKRVEDYLFSSLITRLDSQENGLIIVIQQRLSELDPAGLLKEKDGFVTLSLPAIAQKREVIPLERGKTWERNPGDLLSPKRFSLETLKRLEKDMGKTRFSAQYLQNPTPPGGNRLSMTWFKTYSFKPEREMFQCVVQSWDTGLSEEPSSDYSVCTTWGLKGNTWHLLHVFRDRLAYSKLLKKAVSLQTEWQADKIIVEKAGSGISLLSDLRNSSVGGLRAETRAFTPRVDKEQRFEEAIAQIEDGGFAIPEEAPWLDAFKRECLAFPNARHDDQVDSLSQFIIWQKSGIGQAETRPKKRGRISQIQMRREQRDDYYMRKYAKEDALANANRDRLLRGYGC